MFFQTRYKREELPYLHSEDHLIPAEQTGVKQQQFAALFAKYHRLV